jgi:trehalose/maltose transport system permease protein
MTTTVAARTGATSMSEHKAEKAGLSARARSERKLGWMLCAPAVIVMLLVTAYPIAYAIYLSLQRYDLRFPHDHGFVGLRNYGAVFGNSLFWQDLTSTLIITVLSVVVELILGFLLAFVMHRALFGRGVVRASILVPYGIITVVAAFAWRFAFDPTTGFINGLLGTNRSWFTQSWS